MSETQAAVEPQPLKGLFAAIDSQDIEAFAAFLAEDARFRFGSSPPVTGRRAIAEAVAGFYESIAGLSHDVHLFMVEGSTIVCEGHTTYTRHDGSTVQVPFANVFDMEGDKIRDYKIYADLAPLYAS